jgi:glyoxylase-like metal-dependent hydrolase (beta-lactamase superfamily II)
MTQRSRARPPRASTASRSRRPFQVGRVNVLLLDDDPLTLVDTGPNSGTSLDALERALGEHGRRIEDRPTRSRSGCGAPSR